MKEVRIYFECLEQGAHFIKPILEQSDEFKKKPFEIKLIKLTGNFKYYSKLVAPIVYLKDPDILITVIENEIEYPLFQLEISTAVFTEDHELQRFDGIVASTENNCIYGKLSPINKTSQSAHGGNTEFDYITSYKAAYEKFRKMSYHFDWPCDAKGNVIVNSTYLSCQLETIKPDKQPIGKTENPIPFTTHHINLNTGDSFYIFTDGYQDQFGGEKGKKFMAAKMKDLFINICTKSMEEQQMLINETIEDWKGKLEQVDDICIIGVRI
jgi:hypothetical protein